MNVPWPVVIAFYAVAVPALILAGLNADRRMSEDEKRENALEQADALTAWTERRGPQA